MTFNVFYGLLIPFMGTALGASSVFFMRKNMSRGIQRGLTGFAAGVMVAASIWSLLIPAMQQASGMGKLAFIPAVVGILAGFLFLMILDEIIPHLHMNSDEAEGMKSNLKKSSMLVLAVTLHNLPEGMTAGVLLASWVAGGEGITTASVLALTVGIAIQNFPEGAIISMPLKNEGISKTKSFIYGTLSGIVEPIAAFLTILLSSVIVPLLPYLLSFAAGAMIYVVVEELIPEANEGEHSNIATIGFAVGFLIMMILDVALG